MIICGFWGGWIQHNLCKRFQDILGGLALVLPRLPGGNSFPLRALKTAENVPIPDQIQLLRSMEIIIHADRAEN